ncbi:MAG: AraC family transcriptional regulator [Clostridiales bacterium]|jgi:AraC-like DNA-binding protein|nr:AraC family transcriptional regulator [Clostridiales bacterium]
MDVKGMRDMKDMQDMQDVKNMRDMKDMQDIKKPSGFKSEKIIVLPGEIAAQCAENPLTKNAYLSDIGFFPHAKNHYRERGMECGSYIVILCGDGKGFFSVGGAPARPLGKGEMIVIPPNVPHYYGSDAENPWSIYWAHLGGESASRLLEPGNLSGAAGGAGAGAASGAAGGAAAGAITRAIALPIDSLTKLIELFVEAYGVLEMGYSWSGLVYVSKILEHMLGAIYCALASPSPLSRHRRSSRAVEKAILYMNERAGKSARLSDICAAAGFSPAQFSRLFRQATGYSPMDYFLRMKIRRSCAMLDFGDMSVKEAAAALGFGDSYYFSRIFKKVMGMSPSAYKKLDKG